MGNVIIKWVLDAADYKTQLEQLAVKLKAYNDQQDNIREADRARNKELVSAAKSRKRAIQDEELELKKLEAGLKRAFTVESITKFNSEISKTKQNIATLKGEVGGIGNITKDLGKQFGAIGAGIAAAFSVNAVIAFGKEAVNQFIEAEENADRLRKAVVNVGKEGEKAFQDLIAQSERLQGLTIFSDDEIQNAQTQLLNYGLTVEQVKKLIPAVLDLAKANKVDLAQATGLVISGINGQTRALRPLGLAFKDTGDKAENLDQILTRIDAKFKGASESLDTTADKAKKLKNEYGELQESIGEGLVKAFFLFEQRLDSVVSKIDLVNLIPVIGQIKFLKDFLTKSQYEIEQERIKFSKQVQENQLIEIRKNSDEQIAEQIKQQEKNIALLNRAGAQASYKGQQALADQKFAQANLLQQKIDQLAKVQEERATAALIKQQESEEAAAKAKEERTKLQEIRDKKAAAEKEESFKRELIAIKVNADNEKSLASQLATDKEDLEKRTTAITEEELAKKFDLYNRYNKDVSELVSQLTDLNVSEANKRFEAEKKVQDELNKIAQEGIEQNEKDEKAHQDELVKIAQEGIAQNEADEIKALEEKKKRLESLKTASIEVANSIASALFEIQSDNLKHQQDEETKALEEEKNQALSSKRLTEAQKERINKEYAKKEKDLARKQFEESKAVARSQAIIKGALAVVNALATSDDIYVGLILAAAVTATTAAELATINAQKFKKGTKHAPGGMALVGEEGPEFMYVPGGAKILTASQTKKESRVIDAIYENRLEKLLYNDYILPALQKQKQEFQKEKDSSFANNFAKALIYQGLTGQDMEAIRKKGTPIANVDELVYKLAQALSVKDNPRRR